MPDQEPFEKGKLFAGWRVPPKSHLAVFAAVVILFIWQGVAAGGRGDWFHPINLAFHEAGHIVFAPLGIFVGMLGGSLFQCLVPLFFAAAFLKRREPMGLAFCLMWFGQNLIDVAVYIADARDMFLPLVTPGGGEAIHDWNWLLSRLGLVQRCKGIAFMGAAAGWMLMAAAAGAYVWFWIYMNKPEADTGQDEEKTAAKAREQVLRKKLREMAVRRRSGR